jgi:lactoylglutathione lyase
MLIGFKAGDVKSLCIDLEKKQVKFYKKLAVEPFVKHAIIEDPDGHFISCRMASEEELMQISCYHGLHKSECNFILANYKHGKTENGQLRV